MMTRLNWLALGVASALTGGTAVNHDDEVSLLQVRDRMMTRVATGVQRAVVTETQLPWECRAESGICWQVLRENWNCETDWAAGGRTWSQWSEVHQHVMEGGGSMADCALACGTQDCVSHSWHYAALWSAPDRPNGQICRCYATCHPDDGRAEGGELNPQNLNRNVVMELRSYDPAIDAVVPDTDPNLLQNSNFWLGSFWSSALSADQPGGPSPQTRHDFIELVDPDGRIEFPTNGMTHNNQVFGLTTDAWEAVGLSDPWASEEPWTMQLDFDFLDQLTAARGNQLKFLFNLAYSQSAAFPFFGTTTMNISPWLAVECQLSNSILEASIPDWDPPVDQRTFRMISSIADSQAACDAVMPNPAFDCGHLDGGDCLFYSSDGGNPLWAYDAELGTPVSYPNKPFYSGCFEHFWNRLPSVTLTVLFERKSTGVFNVKVKVGEEGAEEGTMLLMEFESDNAWAPPPNPSAHGKTLMPLSIFRSVHTSYDKPSMYLRRWRRVDAGAPPVPLQ